MGDWSSLLFAPLVMDSESGFSALSRDSEPSYWFIVPILILLKSESEWIASVWILSRICSNRLVLYAVILELQFSNVQKRANRLGYHLFSKVRILESTHRDIKITYLKIKWPNYDNKKINPSYTEVKVWRYAAMHYNRKTKGYGCELFYY